MVNSSLCKYSLFSTRLLLSSRPTGGRPIRLKVKIGPFACPPTFALVQLKICFKTLSRYLLIPLLCLLPLAQPRTACWHSLLQFPDGRGDIAALWPLHHQKPTNGLQQLPMRNALRPQQSSSRWSNYRDEHRRYIVPFQIVGQFTADERHRIAEAMALVAKNSCVRFRGRRAEKEEKEIDFLQIRNDRGNGCFSSAVGRLPGGANIINLESNEQMQCAGQLGLILHELFHIVGLWHEHQRRDRHRYIRIHLNNTLPGTKAQMEKVSKQLATTYGVPYDYTSVMHYPKDGFALMPGMLVLETKQPFYQDIIGHAETASPSDFLKVCAIYDCRRCMGRPFRRGLIRQQHWWTAGLVKSASEWDIQRQLNESNLTGRNSGRRGGDHGHGPAEDKLGRRGGHQQEQCRCQWDGCWCRMDHHWHWKPFDGPL